MLKDKKKIVESTLKDYFSKPNFFSPKTFLFLFIPINYRRYFLLVIFFISWNELQQNKVLNNIDKILEQINQTNQDIAV